MADKNPTKPIKIEDYFPPDFFENYYGKKLLYLPKALTSAILDTIFTLDDLDTLFRTNAINLTDLYIIKDHLASEETVPKTNNGQLNFVKLRKQLANGDSLIIRNLQKASENLKHLTDSVSQFLGHQTNVDAYITPPKYPGTKAHIDLLDILIFQISGTKTWKIYNEYENRLECPNRYVKPLTDWNILKPVEKNVETFELSAGDILYLPAGTMHAPFCKNDSSVHLSVGIYPVFWVEYIKAACDILARVDPDFRREAPLQLQGTKQNFKGINKVVKTLADKIIALDPSLVEREIYTDFSSKIGVAAHSPISEALMGVENKNLSEKKFTLLLNKRANFRLFQNEKDEWHLWTLNQKIDLDENLASLILRLKNEGLLSSDELRESLGDELAESIAEVCREIGIAGIEFT